jgi:hypothetical protein
MSDVDQILAERGKRYGEFDNHAKISQKLKKVIFDARPRCTLDPDMCEARELIAHKIARICNGDPRWVDSWSDVAGYATLVARRLSETDATD